MTSSTCKPIFGKRRSLIFKFWTYTLLSLGIVTAITVFYDPNTLTRSRRTEVEDRSTPSKYDLGNRFGQWFSDTFDVPDPLLHQVGALNTTSKHKYIIYRCDTQTMTGCGGWADRARGMFTAFLIANLTGRTFKAQSLMPKCAFETFIVPNQIDWSLPVSFHETVVPSENVKVLDMWVKPEYYVHFDNINFIHHPFMDSDYVYMKTMFDNMDNFRDTKIYGNTMQWMDGHSRAEINRYLFTQLFRPSVFMQHKIASFLTHNVKPEERLICLHLRMGRSPTLPEETRKPLNFSHLSGVSDFLRDKISEYKHSKIFIMTDSDEAIARMKTEAFSDRIFHAPGQIVHIELSENVSDELRCQGLEKVILEELILMQCDTLMITMSGLSRMASYVRGTDEELYCFKEDKVKPCTRLSLYKVYNLHRT